MRYKVVFFAILSVFYLLIAYDVDKLELILTTEVMGKYAGFEFSETISQTL